MESQLASSDVWPKFSYINLSAVEPALTLSRNTTVQSLSGKNMDNYSTAIATICTVGILANCLLLFLSIRSPTLHPDHKYLLLITPSMDLVYALCFLLIAPIPHTCDFTFVFVSTGPAYNWWPWGMIFVVFLCLATMSTLVSVGNNFLYRYITLCRSNLSYIYSSAKHLIMGILVNSLPVLNWLAMIYFILWPSEQFAEMAEIVWNGKVQVADKVYLGTSNLGGSDPIKMAILIESLVMLLTVAQVSPFCAMRIHHCLKSSLFSTRTKEMHKKMLTMLSIQITCPTILMHLPLSIMYLLFFSGLRSSFYVSCFVGVAMAFYPLMGPVITILFVKDYRRFILCALRLSKKSPISLATVATVATLKTMSTSK